MRYYQLRSLFDPDNIRSGDSLQTLKDLGKIEGLETALHTHYRVIISLIQKGIYKDAKDHEARVKHFGDNQPIVKPPKTITELVTFS